MEEDSLSSVAQEEIYTRIKVLGRGAFGEAVLYRKSDNDQLVVWKEVNVRNPRNAKEVENEIEILSLLSHPNIIGYLNHYFDENMLYIEMEYANGGSLYHKIASQESFISEEIVLWFFYQTVSAVQYLHAKYILHRDIKALNIFLTKSGLAKLGDFGMSKILENDMEMAKSVVGTPYYMSPELIRGIQYNSKSDMWAVGCVLHEMLTLEKTFQATNTLKLASEIIQGKIAQIDSSYSPGMTELLNLCLKSDADKRASADELMLHSLLQTREKEFAEKIASLAPLPHDNDILMKSGRGSVSDGHQSTVPVMTSSTSELYIWGGGKTQPQKLDTFADGKTALKASIGSRHIAVISVEKELYTWTTAQHGKSGTDGELGHGDVAAYKQPKLIRAFEGMRIVSVACGADFTICATEYGSVYNFGSNYYGCIGCGDENVENQLIPYEIEQFRTEPVKFVACGEHHVIAVTNENRVFSWGLGEFGRLGTGVEDDAFSPQLVNFPLKLEFVQVACGTDCTFFLSSSGKLLACGSNEFNKLGFNQNLSGPQGEKPFVYDTPYASVPTLVKPLTRFRILAVASGRTHSACIDEFGAIQTFGCNEFGQLGQGDRKPYKIPKPVKGKLTEHKVVKISCGDGFTVAATSDNQVYSWGLGEDGRLGLDVSLSSSKGFQGATLPRPCFGTLCTISVLESRGWSTVLVSEKVHSQKTLRPSSATTGSKNQLGASNGILSTSSVLKEITSGVEENAATGFQPKTETDETPAFFGDTLGGHSSDVPPWLKDELEQGEVIKMNDSARHSTDSTLQDSGNESTNINELQSKIDSLIAQNDKLKSEILTKDRRIQKLESKLMQCKCEEKPLETSAEPHRVAWECHV